MKKTLTVVVILIATIINAQSDSTKLIQKVQSGMIVGTSANTTFLDSKKPFSLSYYLLANITIITPKTYHNLMYGFGNNSVKFLTGYFISENKKWDVYMVYSKELSVNQNNLTAGIEKLLNAEDLKCFLFSEFGIDFKGTKTLSFGARLSLQNVF